MFSPLDIFLAFSGFFLALGALFFGKNRISFFFRFVIFFGGISLILFTIFPIFLKQLGNFFWLERGADLLVYVSVAFLFYFTLFLLKEQEETKIRLTKIIREIALWKISDQKNFSPKIIFTIACYNEEKIISETIEKIFAFDKNFGIIVIDDGSSDDTPKILKNLEEKFSYLLVLTHSQNLGQWAALETGFEYIRRMENPPEFVVTFDADGQHDISDLSKMLEFLKQNTETQIILGSRFLAENQPKIPFLRKIILKWGIFFTRLISGISLTDTHNGFRVLRKNILTKIKISIDGMGHASEILDIIAKEKIPFHEMPTTIHYTDYSLHKGQHSSNSIKIALKMIGKKFF